MFHPRSAAARWRRRCYYPGNPVASSGAPTPVDILLAIPGAISLYSAGLGVTVQTVMRMYAGIVGGAGSAVIGGNRYMSDPNDIRIRYDTTGTGGVGGTMRWSYSVDHGATWTGPNLPGVNLPIGSTQLTINFANVIYNSGQEFALAYEAVDDQSSHSYNLISGLGQPPILWYNAAVGGLCFNFDSGGIGGRMYRTTDGLAGNANHSLFARVYTSFAFPAYAMSLGYGAGAVNTSSGVGTWTNAFTFLGGGAGDNAPTGGVANPLTSYIIGKVHNAGLTTLYVDGVAVASGARTYALAGGFMIGAASTASGGGNMMRAGVCYDRAITDPAELALINTTLLLV